jgi:hypothetical protein
MNKTMSSSEKSYTMRAIVAVMVVGALVLGLAGPAQARAPRQEAIQRVYVSNVRNTGFVVSWTTTTPSNGIVEYGTTTALGSSRTDAVTNTTTHYVSIPGSASRTYYFRVRSGTLVDDNGGSLYTVTTGPTLAAYTPGAMVYGNLFVQGGSTPVANAIIYLQLQDVDGQGSPGVSQWITVRTDASGGWGYTLGGARTQNAQSYFSFTPGVDNLRIVWQGGAAGCIGEVGAPYLMAIPDVDTSVNMNLDAAPTAVVVQSFWARAAGQPLAWLALGAALLALLGLLAWWAFPRLALRWKSGR